ncbi:N-acetyltransferase family protein [Microvirga sp. 2MCAF38]|uniref:GNAT family N-acetyltransferase n=1 Tax=Microvirga sp. 2MCAF38 TaxID=3232989 RepID=UPI003F9BF526
MIEICLLDAKAAEADRAQLAETLADCVAGGASVSFMWPFTVEDAHRWWGNVIDKVGAGDTVLFGAYVDGVLSGTVQLGLDCPPNQRHRGDVKKLLVHRRARGRGVAGQLMLTLEQEAKNRNLSLITLDTVTGSYAERLYGELGWTKAGIIPNFAMWPDGRLCDATVFWKALPT